MRVYVVPNCRGRGGGQAQGSARPPVLHYQTLPLPGLVQFRVDIEMIVPDPGVTKSLVNNRRLNTRAANTDRKYAQAQFPIGSDLQSGAVLILVILVAIQHDHRFPNDWKRSPVAGLCDRKLGTQYQT